MVELPGSGERVLTKSFVSMSYSRRQLAPHYAADVRDDVARTLATYADEAGQYNSLGPDPWQVLWNDERSGFIAFLEGRWCLVAWRSPVSSEEGKGDLLARLVAYAKVARKPLFGVEVSETTKSAAVDLGMAVTWVGTESYLDLATWSLEGGKRQKVRWARSHAVALGVHWREAHPWTDADDRLGIDRVEAMWKEERPERRTDSFLRTDFTELCSERRYFVAHDGEGVVAVVTCTPLHENGWYLQDIVRTVRAPRGALEGAMVFALDTFRDEGFSVVSNGPMPFWHPYEGWSDPDELGVVGRRVMNFFDQRYRFKGINTFRSKFEPDWTRPIYLIRSRRSMSPLVLRSLTTVLSGKVPWPSTTRTRQ